ncbi:MAG: hypothetical protein QNJ06_09515 [Kiloniellales bacterium]|nr:hypothetical protein [Kiloniellales bacterium]MDJ0970129.1 hypothetical protein [Kiloniellales bacterium]MDJ0982754.1 hypothetical protein [Kiloniellales bacterium]
MIPITSAGVQNFSFARSFAALAQAAARPAFELQFNAAQNAVLDRLDTQIADLQSSDLFLGKTATLRVKLSQLENRLPEIESYRESVTTNRTTTLDILNGLAEARDLTDPGTVAEFDAKLAEVVALVEKLQTRPFALIGVDDGLLQTKPQVQADLAAITTNNFATAADIQAVQDTIDSLTTTLNGTLAVLEINDDDAFDSLAALQRQQAEVQRQIDGIETEQRQQRLDEVNDLREQASRTLSIISLGFEGSQNITQFLTENLTLSQRPAPGSVLNLFV